MHTRTTRSAKWYRPGKPGVTRCPVIVMTGVGPHQCELTREYPHIHPVEVRSSDRYEVQL